MESRKNKLTEEDEKRCIAIKVRKNVIYMYPFDAEVASSGAKICTRVGDTVKQIKFENNGTETLITGILNGERKVWDIAGRAESPYVDNDDDLYIPERFFDPYWKDKIEMSNAEWSAKYQKKHPYAKRPQ